MIYRELKESEIPFGVSAYEDMLKEIGEEDDVNILPTHRTLDSIYLILKNNYKFGIKSYVAVDEGQIIGYILFCSDILTFDLKQPSVYLLAFYIEKEYRNKNISFNLLRHAETELTGLGVKIVTATFLNRRRKTDRLLQRYGLTKVTGVYKKL